MRLFRRDGLGKVEREVRELGSLRLRMARVKPISNDDRELVRFVNSWSMRCAEPLRNYCHSVLSRLVSYFTPESINELLSEVLVRGLSIETALIMLSQCDLLHCNEYSLREYMETGKVDINQLMGILSSQGIKISPEDLRAIVNGDHRVNQARGGDGFSWLPRFVRLRR
ncbi:hypothetical protein [Vulcanisaeta distributa]|uniref:hypothetical protein n=1 Tax=Vulcanisaeta distributa TaxID=164451 RepID=UPI0006D1B577|nr:hypothetical protein [Vulcanisaeta distributa]